MDASWKNCFEEELLCPICLNVFDEPIQLPCKHNFCKGCISEAWAKESAAVRCPECNHDYDKKPTLEKNFKLANIVKRFNALNTEKVPAVLHCVLCRRGPPLPVRKVCLRCKEPCCQTHIQTHLQQPCAAPGHLLVDAEELSAWTCPSHEEYRLLHCEEEQVALCPFCCISHCTNQRHTVCDVDTQRVQKQAMLMRQQDRLEGRVQNIDEQLNKLESDKTLMKDAVSELKERVSAQYQRMRALLEANQVETLQMLESTYIMYVRKNSQQVLQLNEKRQEAEKLLSSVQRFFLRAESVNFMKNTKPYQLLMDRSNSHLNGAIPPLRVGQLSSHNFLSDLSTREKNLRKMLEEPLNEVPVIEIVQSHSSSSGSQLGTSSGLQKRKYDMAFLERNSENSASQDAPPLLYSGKKPFLADQNHHASSMYSSEVLPQNPHSGPGHSRLLDTAAHHMVGLGSSSSHHSGNFFPSSHFPSGGASQQAMLGGRKVLMCTLNNCCCSRAPASRGQSSYAASNSFPSMTSQEFSSHASLPASQPLQHFPMRGLLEAQTARHPDFYGLYGQSSTKHYGTK
ncbi:E3 ubiquitin-protein ligase TRIM8a [Melanotaenia boesemani]|uniref:E3 ubiquitin-protein ligase TRIM8a n=1 Tax=Melanotaenia boesemani TaxID=1250792 RepID=UPI001C04BDD8|nr:E3 ubiquitin-protein ligase TRIM8a [Melanotaenia boesemani]XP_041866302.1 E3 ubiquitin-protein ligase TRIM8a [Melanotaenia boesemani]XP_041866303.1 E3 ubiquitin-protein ligase TRIM8a [Melanotaenia boesemani]XP_041866304.1 E3 ubiquitin-protein ligase TRIM8a [Melanotaenia boesemani]XP_041866305.1 E3 ubiquitin-protein ligase TRIM8a [Melanotaenia boesemani]XP_041866306.1 E3 ubiquitin-protein ligase TRIM8a [Melanotaenia boesemani]